MKSLTSLKAWVIVAFIVLWNVGCMIAIRLNGGTGQLVEPAAGAVMGVTCVAASLFALSVGLSTGVQNALLADTRRHNFRRADFLLVAGIAGVLSVVTLAYSFQ